MLVRNKHITKASEALPDIRVIQYDGTNLRNVVEFTGKHENFDKYFSSWEDYEAFVADQGYSFKIINDGEEKDQFAFPGDFVASDGMRNFVIPRLDLDRYYDIIEE